VEWGVGIVTVMVVGSIAKGSFERAFWRFWFHDTLGDNDMACGVLVGLLCLTGRRPSYIVIRHAFANGSG
jgi:hypothetical protein